jgi:hypothetical protein
MRRFLITVALALTTTPVWAQQVKIAFHDGQVSVETVAAAPRAILAEWSRIGGTNIVNGERVTGAPLTLKLVDVPEAQALEIILRSVAGYMAAPRGQTPGVSRYDRILVLPTSSMRVAANPPTPARPNPAGPAVGTQRFVPPRPVPAQPVEEAPEIEEPVDVPQAEPVFAFPQPSQPAQYRNQPAWQVGAPPVMGSDSAVGGAPGGSPTFGVVGAPVPGMIQQMPAPQPQQQQPATPGLQQPVAPGQQQPATPGQQQPATPGRPTRPPGQ